MDKQIYFCIAMAFVAVAVLVHETIGVLWRLQESAATNRGSLGNETQSSAYGGLLPGDMLKIKMIIATVLGSMGLILIFIQISKADQYGFVVLLLTLLVFGVVFYVSYSVPDAIARLLYERRMRMLNRQLVDAMSVLALALRSGKNFEAALPIVAEEVPGQLGEEFDRVVQEMHVGGIPMEEAMTRLSERLPFKDMKIFVSSMLIVSKIGGSQAEILERSSQLIRERFLILEKCLAMTAEGRFTAIAISLAPVFILAVNMVINYDMASKFMTHPIGILVLVAIGISDFIGYKILTSITKSTF